MNAPRTSTAASSSRRPRADLSAFRCQCVLDRRQNPQLAVAQRATQLTRPRRPTRPGFRLLAHVGGYTYCAVMQLDYWQYFIQGALTGLNMLAGVVAANPWPFAPLVIFAVLGILLGPARGRRAR